MYEFPMLNNLTYMYLLTHACPQGPKFGNKVSVSVNIMWEYDLVSRKGGAMLQKQRTRKSGYLIKVVLYK